MKNFFQMFDFPIIQGKIDSTVLNWIIVTQNYAKQHFGDQNPIDKTVFIKDLDSEKDHGCVARIVAVIEDLPANSSIQPTFLLTVESSQKIGIYSIGDVVPPIPIFNLHQRQTSPSSNE